MRLLRSEASVRGVLFAVGGGALLLFITQIVLPGTGAGRGTPGAILFSGLVLGMVNALTAAGLVLVYRTTRIINFAQTAIGAAGAELTFQFVQLTRVPFPLAFVAGLVLAALLGLLFDIVFVRRFFNAPRLVLTVCTIAVAGLSAATVQAVRWLPFFPQERSLQEAFGAVEIRNMLPFSGFRFQVGDLGIPFGFPEVFAIEVVLVGLLLVAAFFRFTRAGVAVRALAENPERAALLGISTGSLSSIVWTIAGVLGGASVILTGMLTTPGASQGVAPGVLLPALAAAVVAGFRSLPVAFGASIAIAVLAGAFQHSLPEHAPLVRVALFLVIAVGLLLQRRQARRSEEGAGVAWQAVEEQRPIPRELAELAPVRVARWTLAVLGVAGVILYPFLVGTGATVLGGVVAITTVLALSLVVLTGWAGQVSLGQWAFAAVGGVVGGALTAKVGLPFWLAVPAAVAVSAAFAALVGLPALRIRGLFLAVTTLALAYAVASALFQERYFGWLVPSEVERPTLFLLDFEDERSMYFLCVAALVATIVVVRNLRRSRTGRILIAARENEANLQSFGVDLVRTKLLAFAISGGLAGLAGVVFVHQQRGISADLFGAERSVELFLLVVIGGVGSIGGALLGSALWASIDHFFATNAIVAALRWLLPILVLYALPGGLISLVTRLRDEGLRVMAQRRQIVVPSLFADYDPDALTHRLIPLREASRSEGLASLGARERYALPSELYDRSASHTETPPPDGDTDDLTSVTSAGPESTGATS